MVIVACLMIAQFQNVIWASFNTVLDSESGVWSFELINPNSPRDAAYWAINALVIASIVGFAFNACRGGVIKGWTVLIVMSLGGSVILPILASMINTTFFGHFGEVVSRSEFFGQPSVQMVSYAEALKNDLGGWITQPGMIAHFMAALLASAVGIVLGQSSTNPTPALITAFAWVPRLFGRILSRRKETDTLRAGPVVVKA